MAKLCPHAEYDPLGPQTQPRLNVHDIVCLHTMAGTLEGVRALFKSAGYSGVESHFGVGGSSKAYQWQHTDYSADANLNGNWHIISIETADKGETFPEWTGSDVPKWTPDQVDKIVDIVVWCCKTYKIPPKLIPDSKRGRRGIAYHRQGIDGNFTTYKGRVPGGELWSESFGKACPGDRRIEQLIKSVIPKVQDRLRKDPDFDYTVTIVRGDERHTKRFERLRKRASYYIRRKAKRGWRVIVRKVKGGNG